MGRPSKLGVAWTAGRLAGRRLLGRAVGERDVALGDVLTAQLDEMKGLAMKVGQIVSYLDVPLPDVVQERLARLQTGVRGMPAAEVRQVIESALHREVEDAFESFSWEPIAAASIGQVHRARVGGRPVAVKVRYPGIDRSFADDLRTVGRISSLASAATAVDGRLLVQELQRRLAEECDYVREARAQQAFARAFAGDDAIVVPDVLPQVSAASVLTTEWIDGDDFASVSQHADAARRNAVAETLVRFAYRSLFQLAAIQADPHPGNYVFAHDGTVAFLDFGCVRVLDVEMVDALRGIAVSVRDRDPARFRRAVDDLGVVGRPKRFDYDYFFAVMEHLHRPLVSPRFSIDAAYVREGYALNGPRNPNARTMAMPPAYIWVARLQWGLWSVLARLRASGCFRGLFDELLSRPVTPLALPDPTPATFRATVPTAAAALG